MTKKCHLLRFCGLKLIVMTLSFTSTAPYLSPSGQPMVREVSDFRLSDGALLKKAHIGFTVFCEGNKPREERPIVVVTVPLGFHHNALGQDKTQFGSGWLRNLAGMGKNMQPNELLNPQESFILCIDHFGANGIHPHTEKRIGSTAASELKSWNPEYAATHRDTNLALEQLLQAFEIEKVDCYIGPSLGSMTLADRISAPGLTPVDNYVSVNGFQVFDYNTFEFWDLQLRLFNPDENHKELAGLLRENILDSRINHQENSTYGNVLQYLCNRVEQLESFKSGNGFNQAVLPVATLTTFLRTLPVGFFNQGMSDLSKALGFLSGFEESVSNAFCPEAYLSLIRRVADAKSHGATQLAKYLADNNAHLSVLNTKDDFCFPTRLQDVRVESALALNSSQIDHDTVPSIHGHNALFACDKLPLAFLLLAGQIRQRISL